MKVQIVAGGSTVTVKIKGHSVKKFKRVAKQTSRLVVLDAIEPEEHLGFVPNLRRQ